MIHAIRGFVLPGLVILCVAFGALGTLHPEWWVGLALFGALLLLAIYDKTQKRHSILRNYPVLGHFRFLLEDVGPELHQYLVESNTDGTPFDRDQRSLIYERAKNVEDKKPFGTELDVYAEGYAWISHSMAPHPLVPDASKNLRVEVGGPLCTQPYSASVLNISAMSFGALSANAVKALNLGAKKGGFAHNTGEGGLSRHHRSEGGDIIWQIGTGYFGCRNDQGRFDAELFAEQSTLDQVKMIELKLSQGAKPGHGGILPGPKVSEEIAEARKVPVGQDCLSPPGHQEFSTPRGLIEFVAQLRELCGGKPVGFKLCVGDPREFLGVCKAMIETGITPDFITVDGAEGGTGAAPLEFSDHLGMPLVEGLLFVHNALVGTGLRDKLRVACSAKRISAFDIAAALGLGADWCNVARGFMMSVGCIQSQRCHANDCPVGVATQNKTLQRALDVQDKGERAFHFHKNTVETLAELIAAAGLDHPCDLQPHHVWQRINTNEARNYDEIYPMLQPGDILEGRVPERLQKIWDAASADAF